MMKKEMLVYMAGALDSGGSISILRRERGCFYERVTLSRVVEDVPLLFSAAFGGTVNGVKPSFQNGRPVYRWSVEDQRAAACLRALQPYVRVQHRKDQIANILKFRALQDTRRSTMALEACYLRAVELNKHRTS